MGDYKINIVNLNVTNNYVEITALAFMAKTTTEYYLWI